MSVTRTNVSNAIETVVWDRILIPIAYNVPMHEVADIWRLPREGDVLKVTRGDEAAEATALSKDSVYDLTNTTGQDDSTIYYDQYTIVEKGLFTNVNKWAEVTTQLDVANFISRRLLNSAHRTLNSDSYDALAAQSGLQYLRVDGQTETAVEMAFTINSATGLSTTSCRTDLTQIDDWWNNGQVVMTSGPNWGLARKTTDFVNVNGVLTFDAFPVAPTNGDTGKVCVVGNDTTSGPSDIAATDTITLAQLMRARAACLKYGAGGMGMEGSMMNIVGVTRKMDGIVRQGLSFMPIELVHELQLTLFGNQTAAEPFYQTSEAFRRAVGGNVINLAGLMVIPINYYKRIAVTDGALAVGSGAGHPAVVLFPHAFGCSLLKDPDASRQQGMSIQAKKISPSSEAYMYKSLRYRGELDIVNKYFCANSLHGAVLWCGSNLNL